MQEGVTRREKKCDLLLSHKPFQRLNLSYHWIEYNWTWCDIVFSNFNKSGENNVKMKLEIWNKNTLITRFIDISLFINQ